MVVSELKLELKDKENEIKDLIREKDTIQREHAIELETLTK